MRGVLRTALIVSVVVGSLAALVVGCGSSSDGSGGSAGTSSGGAAGAATGGAGGAGAPATSAGTGTGGSGGGAAAGAPNPADNGGASGGDNGGDSAGAAGEASGPLGCNSLVQLAPPITSTHSADAAPVLGQGNIQAGTYYLTSYTSYTAAGTDFSVAATIVVTVTNKTATLNSIDSAGTTGTIDVVMGTPATAAPVSVIATCSTDPRTKPLVGLDLKAAVSYGISGAAGDVLTIFIAAQHIKQVFTLQP